MGPPPPKRPNRTPGLNKTAIQPARVLNASSPILSRDLHTFLHTALCPASWSQYSDEQKYAIIELLPTPYRNFEPDQSGKMRCPLGADFLQEDTHVKAAVLRFERDLKDGFWEAGWGQQAWRANEMKLDGRFDDYVRDKVEESFGDEDVQDDDADMDDESDIDSAAKRQKTETAGEEEEFVIETLLRDSKDGETVEVKWRGYEVTTWELRAGLEKDVPDMLAAFDGREVQTARAERRGDMVEVDGMPATAPGQ